MYSPAWTEKISRIASKMNPTKKSSNPRLTSGRRQTNESAEARAWRRRRIQVPEKKGTMK
jgi:hypothetical protein